MTAIGCTYCGAGSDEITSYGPDAICCETTGFEPVPAK